MGDEIIIKHGLFKSYTGSSNVSIDKKTVFVTVNGPVDSSNREETIGGTLFEIRCKSISNSKAFENMCISIINKILEKYIEIKEMNFKTISINVYANTIDLSMICNAVAIAVIDAGIPLKSMFYCVGCNPFFVFSNGNVDFYQSLKEVTNQEIEEAKQEQMNIKEHFLYAFRDVFKIQ